MSLLFWPSLGLKIILIDDFGAGDAPDYFNELKGRSTVPTVVMKRILSEASQELGLITSRATAIEGLSADSKR